MTGPAAIRPADRQTTGLHVPSWVVLAVVIAVAATAIFVPLSRLLAPPSFVERITFENPTDYDLYVEVTDAEREGWLAVGTAHKGRTTTVEDTVDQGEAWIFRFASQGEQGGELRISRSQLQRDDWKVHIPVAIAETLRANALRPRRRRVEHHDRKDEPCLR